MGPTVPYKQNIGRKIISSVWIAYAVERIVKSRKLLLLTKITAINIKNKHKAQYPDISSVSKPIEHSETLPHPEPGMSSISRQDSEDLFVDDESNRKTTSC